MSDSLADRIVHALILAGGSLHVRALARQLGAHARDVVKAIEHDGRVQRTGRGVYGLR